PVADVERREIEAAGAASRREAEHTLEQRLRAAAGAEALEGTDEWRRVSQSILPAPAAAGHGRMARREGRVAGSAGSSRHPRSGNGSLPMSRAQRGGPAINDIRRP